MSGYRDGIVAYIDVLGWSQIVDRSAAEPELFYQLSTVLGRVKERVAAIVSGAGYSHGARAHQFSDANFLTIDKSDDATRIGPEYATLWCRLLAREYLKAGFLVRGGMTIGKFYDDGFACFGPAVTQAYRLEQSIGEPMIVIDPNRKVQEIFLDAEQYGSLIGDFKGEAMTMNPLAQTRGGIVFIDYLRLDVSSHPEFRPHDVMSIEEESAAIKKQESAASTLDLKARSKSEWFLNYANGAWRSRSDAFLKQIDFPAVSASRRRLTHHEYAMVSSQ